MFGIIKKLRKTDQDLKKRIQELALIHEFSQKMVSNLELEEFYKTLDLFLGERLGFQEFALLLYDDKTDEAVVKVARGFPQPSKIEGIRFKAGEGITGHVLKTCQPLYIPDTRQEPRYLSYKGARSGEGSFLSIPLLGKGKLVGILNLFRPSPDAFSSQEVQFLKTIAVEMAIALMNAGLYSRTRELAVRDELTDLYNRRHFREVFPLEIKRAQRFKQQLSLLMIDLDQFKRFNDTYGHLEGDRCLRELARLMSSNIREVDLIGRFGGEEFVVLLPNTIKPDALIVAEKLRQIVRSNPFRPASGETAILTVSVGVASYPLDGESPEVLLDAADAALYQAKWAGRDRVVPFQPQESKTSAAER